VASSSTYQVAGSKAFNNNQDVVRAWPMTPRLKVTMAGATSIVFLMVILRVAGRLKLLPTLEKRSL
jgi:hypothetical protein